jgi:hypothetical protein
MQGAVKAQYRGIRLTGSCYGAKEKTSCSCKAGCDSTGLVSGFPGGVNERENSHIILVLDSEAYHHNRHELCWCSTHGDYDDEYE